LLTVCVCLVSTGSIYGQLSNDDCGSAQFIDIPADGDTCFSASNLGSEFDGNYHQCESSGDQEVYYEFTAQGSDNTVTVTPEGGTCSSSGTIEIKTDNYPGETSWGLRNTSTSTLVDTGDSYSNANTVHTHNQCLTDGDTYEFCIYDAFGDGICCSYGEGYWKVENCGSKVDSGGDFSSKKCITFTAGSCPGTGADSLSVALDGTGCGDNAISTCDSMGNEDSVSINWGFSQGDNIIVEVSTPPGSEGDYEVCITSKPPPPTAGNTCALADTVCDKSSFAISDLSSLNSSGYQPSCFGGTANQDAWVKFTVGESGTFEFGANPLSNSTEYDWAMYDVTNGCPAEDQDVACNWNYASSDGTPTGMGTIPSMGDTSCASCPVNGINADTCMEFCQNVITVDSGKTYALLIDNYSNDDVGFNLQWGGTFKMAPTAAFDMTLDPGDCADTIVAHFNNQSVAADSFYWDFDNGNTSTKANPDSQIYTNTDTTTYVVTLQAFSDLGCSDVTSQSLSVCPLDVELLTFKGRNQENRIRLDWVTATEQNNDYFEVQRLQEEHYTTLGRIEGAGTSTHQHTYQFYDEHPLQGTNQYRLKFVSNNGNVDYSNPIQLQFTGDLQFRLTSVQSRDNQQLKLDYIAPNSQSTQIKVYNVRGEEVVNKEVTPAKGVNTHRINTNNWPKGMYVIKLEQDGQLIHQKHLHR
jgi:hypothetical protein